MNEYVVIAKNWRYWIIALCNYYDMYVCVYIYVCAYIIYLYRCVCVLDYGLLQISLIFNIWNYIYIYIIYIYIFNSQNGTIFSGWWLSAHPQTYQPVGEHNPKPKGGWWLTYPSEKWWSESQLGWWNSQLNGKIIHMFQTTNQYIYI